MKGCIMVFMILFIIILIAVPPYFYIFVIQPKAQEIQALEKGPGGIAELTAQRDADKAFIANIEQYEKQLTDAQKELAKLKKSKKHK